MQVEVKGKAIFYQLPGGEQGRREEVLVNKSRKCWMW